MRNFAVLGASALVLAIGVGAASAEPFNPVTGYENGPYRAPTYGSNSVNPTTGFFGFGPSYGYNGALNEGRAADEGYGYYNGWTTGDPLLEQFHEPGRGSNFR